MLFAALNILVKLTATRQRQRTEGRTDGGMAGVRGDHESPLCPFIFGCVKRNFKPRNNLQDYPLTFVGSSFELLLQP